MKTIADLLSRTIEPKGKVRQPPRAKTLSCRLSSEGLTSPTRIYETAVFNYLFENKKALGIESVIKFQNLHVDGQIVLVDKRRFVIEVKYRMNWLKQCQAVWEFNQFLSTEESQVNRVNGAIVVFEEFTGDWNKKANKEAKNLWGWEGWYLKVFDCVPEKPMHLIWWCEGAEPQGYPD